MDSVPYKFVDYVVELFDGKKTLNPLAQEVTHPLWKAAVDVHHRNREYYEICIRKIEGNIKIVAEQQGTWICGDLEPIRKNRRFARILGIEDYTDDWDYTQWEHAQILEDVEAVKWLESVAPQLEMSSTFSSCHLRCQDIVVNSLSSRLFSEFNLYYNGQPSFDFLERQIINSPFLERVCLTKSDDRWPMSVLPLLEMFCLKRKPGRQVSLEILHCMETTIDIDFIQKFFDHWKERKNLNFTISCHEGVVEAEHRRTILERGEVTEITPGFPSVFRHESAKSIAICYPEGNSREFLEFCTCECGLSRRCRLKKGFPAIHNEMCG
uniref:FBA_2 domain-containing protein n=1 Tax=Steinernema glaseri TaxID=37863 RepID=A0A1I7Y6Y6_9BILA